MKTLSNLINEKSSTLTDQDVVLGLTLINPNLLDFTTSPENRYMFKSHVLHNMLKHSAIQFKDKIKWEVPNRMNSINLDVEKNWNLLRNIKNKADSLRGNYEKIDNVTFTENGIKINNTDNLLHNNKKAHSSRKLFDNIFGVNNSLIYQNPAIWDKLIQTWLRLVFRYASPETRGLIEQFMFDNQIEDVTYQDYKKISVNDDYKYLGVNLKGLDKNFKKLSTLLATLYKNPAYWIDHKQFKEHWQAIKNEILNKHVLLPLFRNNVDNASLKKNVLHFLADHFDLQDEEYTDLNKLKKIPSRNKFLDNDIKLAISFWNNPNFDFIYLIKCLNLQNEEIGSIAIEVGWPTGTPENSINAKAKLHNLNLDNLMPNVAGKTMEEDQ